MSGEKVNFFIEYDGEEEDGPVPHVLTTADYRTTDDAPYDSWLLLVCGGCRGRRGDGARGGDGVGVSVNMEV